MKWLDRLLGVEQAENAVHNNRPIFRVQRYGRQGELTEAVKQYIVNSTHPFTIRDVSAGIGHFDPLGRGLHKTVHSFEKKGLVKVLPRDKGALMTWEKVERKAKAPVKTASKKGAVRESILRVLRSSTAPMTTVEIRSALGRPARYNNDPIYASLCGLSADKCIRKAGTARSKGGAILWEAVKPVASGSHASVVLPNAIPTPSHASQPLTVPFYYDAEFRIVAKRDKRLVALVERKRTDALGCEHWEAVNNGGGALYMEAMRVLAGELIKKQVG